MKNWIKNNKKLIVEFLSVLFFCIVICNGFLRVHYTTDTYKIACDGYKNYAINWSLKDGRIFAYAELSICELLNIPIKTVIFSFTLLGLIISSITVIIIKNVIESIKPFKNLFEEIMVLMISFLTIFNFMYIEAIYFLEITIISFSILMFVLASKVFCEQKKNYVLNTILLCIIGILSYQGTISYFIAFSVFLKILQIDRIDKCFWKFLLQIGLISLFTMVFDIYFVKKVGEYIGIEQNRMAIDTFLANINNILQNWSSILINTCNLFPKFLFIIILCLIFLINIIVLLKEKMFKKSIFKLIMIVVITIFSNFLIFIGTTSSFDCGRMYITLGALPCFMILFLYVNSESVFSKNVLGIISILILIMYFMFNTINYFIKIDESRTKNKLEKEYCNEILKYCNENDLELNDACILPIELNYEKIYFEEVKTRNKMTINEIRGYESAICGFNINTGLKLNDVAVNNEIIEKYNELLNSGYKGINDSYSMYIDGVLVMPVFIW